MAYSKLKEHVRVNIRVSPEVHQFFKNRSEQCGVSMSALMFLELEKYVNEQKKKK